MSTAIERPALGENGLQRRGLVLSCHARSRRNRLCATEVLRRRADFEAASEATDLDGCRPPIAGHLRSFAQDFAINLDMPLRDDTRMVTRAHHIGGAVGSRMSAA